MEVIPPKETLSFAFLFPQELEPYKTKLADEADEDWESEWEVDDADEDSDMDGEYDHDVRNVICLEISKWKNFSVFFISSFLYSLVFLYDFVLHH